MNGRVHPIDALSAYLDGVLAPDERLEVERHLETCDECARRLADLRTLAEDLRSERVPEVPAGLDARVRRALDAKRGGGSVVSFPFRWRLPATVAATLGAAALVVISYRFLPLESYAPAPDATPAPIRIPMESPESLRTVPVSPGKDEVAPPPKPKRQTPDRREGRADRVEPVLERPMAPAAPAAAASDEALAPAAGLARVAGDREQGPRTYTSTIILPPGPECRGTYEPYDAPLHRTGGDFLAADPFVGSLGGAVVSSQDAPLERVYQVRSDRWEALLDQLTSWGFVAPDGPRGVPPEADCVRVTVEIVPESR